MIRVVLGVNGVLHPFGRKDRPFDGAVGFLERCISDVGVWPTICTEEDPIDVRAWLREHAGELSPAPNVMITRQWVDADVYVLDRVRQFNGHYPTMGDLREISSWSNARR